MSDLSAISPERVLLRRLAARQALPLGLLCLLTWMLWDRATHLDLGDILASTRAIPAGSWAGALIATLLSFWAVGHYDVVVHRILRTGVCVNRARRAGIAAVATAQTTGFGALVGTLARWRMLPGLSLWQSARLTLCVTGFFMAGLAILAAAASLSAGAAGPAPSWAAAVVLVLASSLAAISLWRPRPLLCLSLPPLRAQAALLGYVAVDTAAAAAVLYLLLPAGSLPGATTFYAVFLLALGAGLIGATPGGLGPFEFVCLTLLPTVPEADLLAAIAGYRLIYFGIPGAAALVLLLSDPAAQAAVAVPETDLLSVSGPLKPGSALDQILTAAPQAESQLLRQRELALLHRNGVPVAMAAETGNSLIVVGSPLKTETKPSEMVAAAVFAARERFLTPCFYKCDARIAAAARRMGWAVASLSQEAWIAPSDFDQKGAARRQLRRKLHQADAAGLRVAEAGAELPLADMQAIFADWARRPGGARGFSMGGFDLPTLERQRVFLCHDDSRRLVGFATFHQTRQEWALDLMCKTAKTPAGAIHLLITQAAVSARARGCPRLSLAAVPHSTTRLIWMPSALARRIDQKSGATGLRQFKASFAPHWRPLYIAAPSRPALAMASLDLVDRITRASARSPSGGVPPVS